MNFPTPTRIARFLQGIPPNSISPSRLFQLHSLLITTGFQFNLPSARLSLLKLYLSNPSTLLQAAALSGHIQEPGKWSLLIRHASANNPLMAMSLFRYMQDGILRFQSDTFIFASLIKACNKARAILEGKSVHCHVIRIGLDCNLNVMNSMVSFYMGSANSVSYAAVVFDEMPERSIVSFNSMISGYAKRGDLDECLRLLRGGFDSNVRPNSVTFVILISGCVKMGAAMAGIAFHCCCFKFGVEWSTEVCNVLIDFYAKNGCIEDAVSVFRDMPGKDLISWNAMMWAYGHNGDCVSACLIFGEMRREGIGVDRVSFSCMLSVCAAAKEHFAGKMIHACVKGVGMDSDVSVGTALINLYGRCGELESARKVFDELLKNDIECWNALIHVYIDGGFSREALKLLDEVESRALEMDEVTVLGLVMACRDAGLIHRGSLAHSVVERNETFKGSLVLGNALIDMYAKCGSMEKARDVFGRMVKRDVVSWTSMIVGYAVNGEGEKSLATFKRMCGEKIIPNAVTFVGVLLACDHAGLIVKGRRLYDVMTEVYEIRPQIEHCGCVVDMLARSGRIEDAQLFVQNMPMEPNVTVWRMLMNACRVHGCVDHGLNLVTGITELNAFCDSADFVISSNMYAEAGRWGDVVSHRGFMVGWRACKTAGKSLVSC